MTQAIQAGLGSATKLTATFTLANVPTDPTTVTLKVTKPDGTSVTHAVGGGTLVKQTTGIYYAVIIPDQSGYWVGDFKGVGVVDQVVSYRIMVPLPVGPELPPLCTIEDVTDHLGGTLPVTHGMAQQAIRVVSGAIRRYTGQRLDYVASEVVTIQPERPWRTIILPDWPVTAMTTVVEDGVTRVSGTDFVWYRDGRLVKGEGAVWVDWPKSIVVTYAHGWNPLPADIVQVAVSASGRMVQGGLRGQYGGPQARISEAQAVYPGAGADTQGSLGISFTPLLSRLEKETLDLYRDRRIV